VIFARTASRGRVSDARSPSRAPGGRWNLKANAVACRLRASSVDAGADADRASERVGGVGRTFTYYYVG
jgi:hypothetical protein